MFKNISLRAKILIGIALICTAYVAMMPDKSQTIEPTHASGAARVASAAKVGEKSPLVNAYFRMKERIVNATTASSLFSVQSWYVAPPPPPPPPPMIAQAPPAPTAPPLPFSFMGSYRPEGATPIYFLTAGDRVYDVKVGDVLDNTYSVDGVKSGQLLLTYIPLKIQQSLAVGNE